jgi:hypothetical protein
MHDSLSRGMATRSDQHYKKVYRHLPGRYYSESNRAAILSGRVDLRVDQRALWKPHENLGVSKS